MIYDATEVISGLKAPTLKDEEVLMKINSSFSLFHYESISLCQYHFETTFCVEVIKGHVLVNVT